MNNTQPLLSLSNRDSECQPEHKYVVETFCGVLPLQAGVYGISGATFILGMFWLVKCLSEVGKPWLFTDPEIAPDVSWVTAVVAGVHFIVSIWLAQRSWTAAQRFSVKAVEQSILLQWACLVLSFICGVILMIRVYNLQVIGPMEMMRRNLLIGTSVAIVSHVILSLYAVLIFRSFNVHIQDVNLLMFGPASDDATYYRPLPPSLPASNMV